MSPSKKQLERLRKISRLAHELTAAIDELVAGSEEAELGYLNEKDTRRIFDEIELKEDYQRLRAAAAAGASIENEVTELIENSSKDRLKAFIRTNGLPIDSNSSKVAIQAQLIQLLRQSKAIGAPVKTLAGIS
jgi:hypothetical protein